ncbi:MAG: patatin-like phospholipase family protein [Acidimicrobiales bacterium]
MPVFGIEPDSYTGGGVVTTNPASSTGTAASGLPKLRWPGRRVRTAFVLGGGANRGAVQVGMLRALSERGIAPDLLVGTSIGAVNAAAFAGEPTIEGIYLAADVWRRIVAEDVFPRGRFDGTWRFLQRREAVYPIDGLRKVVRGFLRFERVEDSPVPLVLVSTRLEDGAEEWITEGPAVEAVLASAALPGLYPPMQVGGFHYFDGGVLDNVALATALSAGARRVFILLCGPVDISVPVFTRPYEAMFAAFGIALTGRLKRDLAGVGPEADVVVFEGLTASGRGEPVDFSRTEEWIEQGYRTARDVLDGYDAVVRARRSSAARARGAAAMDKARKRLRP